MALLKYCYYNDCSVQVKLITCHIYIFLFLLNKRIWYLLRVTHNQVNNHIMLCGHVYKMKLIVWILIYINSVIDDLELKASGKEKQRSV